jgi:hypothetical protein
LESKIKVEMVEMERGVVGVFSRCELGRGEGKRFYML